MKLIDLTYPIMARMPMYPGTVPPEIEQKFTVSVDGFAEKSITMCSHTGTHMDVPAHVLEDGATLDALSIASFAGNGMVINVHRFVNQEIPLFFLEPFKQKIAEADFILFFTGMNKKWGSEEYFSEYPVLSEQAAQWLTTMKLKGIGIDAPSIDKPDDPALPIHKILLGSNMVVVENLTRLGEIGNKQFIFAALPLKIEEGDGSPVRAVAILTPNKITIE